MTRVTIALACLIAAVAAVLYAFRVGDTPMFLSPDETIIAVDAHSLATTGRDVEGVRLPLYFNIQMHGEERRGWFTPAIFYLSVPFVRVLPFTERTVRLPTVFVAVLDVVLMFFVGRALFGGDLAGAFCAMTLAFSPCHFLLGRLAMDYLYPLPFVLAWLLCLAGYFKTDRPWMLFASTLALGAGFFSYIGALVMTPVYLLMTWLALFQRRKPLALYLVAGGGFALPILLFFVPWLLRHPHAFADTMERYELYDPKHQTVSQGLRSLISVARLDGLAALYWSFLSPSFLFLSGGLHLMFSTRTAGVLPVSLAVLVPLGLYRIVKEGFTPANTLMAVGFVTGPLAAVAGQEAGASQRIVEILPFSALLAWVGVGWLWSCGVRLGSFVVRNAMRAAVMFLVVLMPLEFAWFSARYFGEYRLRSAPWFGGNVPGALEALIEEDARSHPPVIYFALLRATEGYVDSRTRWMRMYWQFQLIKHGKLELVGRSRYFDEQPIDDVPAGSLVLANEGDVTADRLVRTGAMNVVARIPEPDGSVFFEVLRK